MNRRQEAALWRMFGQGFESDLPPQFGICAIAKAWGLPAYNEKGARVRSLDNHGEWWDWSTVPIEIRRAAADHRAMTCYLMAEMVLDGRAPGGTP